VRLVARRRAAASRLRRADLQWRRSSTARTGTRLERVNCAPDPLTAATRHPLQRQSPRRVRTDRMYTNLRGWSWSGGTCRRRHLVLFVWSRPLPHRACHSRAAFEVQIRDGHAHRELHQRRDVFSIWAHKHFTPDLPPPGWERCLHHRCARAPSPQWTPYTSPAPAAL